MRNLLRYLSSFIAPVVVAIVLPYLILVNEKRDGWIASSAIQDIIGVIILLAGLSMTVATMRIFIRIGKGTIMPWDPTRKLVVAGPYQYVRNPMILSLVVVVIGEAILFASPWIALLAVAFLVINTIYFHFSEEPGLERRFGAEYQEYKENVGMWIPRLKPWRPG